MSKTTKTTKTGAPRRAGTTRLAGAPPPASKQSKVAPAPSSSRRTPRTKATAAATATPKKTLIANLLRRQHGASVCELQAATGWQSHSIRAAMTGLRKAGGDITRSKDDSGTSLFRLTGGR